MSAQERLECIQVRSGPVMAELPEWIEEEFSERRMEPNGGLGQAFRYVFNHGEGPTRFSTVAGVTLRGASAKSMRLSAAWRFPTDDGVDVCDDEIVNVTDRDSFNTARRLGREEVIFCGGSSGTIAWAALKVAENLAEDDIVVFIVCDTGERYLSKFLSDEWMKEKRLLGEERMTLGLLNELKMHAGRPRLVSVTPETTVGEALDLMNTHGLSQTPVLEGGRSVGSVRDNRVMAQLLDNRELLQATVTQVMGASFPVVNENVEVARAKQYLKDSPAALVEEYGRIVGIVTRHDVLDIQA